MTSLSIGVKRAHRVLVDEAAQSTEATSLVPLLLGCHQAVFIGDEKQLPPNVQSPEAVRAGLDRSLFERLLALDTGEGICVCSPLRGNIAWFQVSQNSQRITR